MDGRALPGSFVRLFACVDGFKARVTTCTQIAGMQMSCAEFVSPDALLDLEFCSPQLDASLRLGAPVSWEMVLGDEHRNGILPLQLGHFYCLFSITMGLSPPAKHPLNGAHTFASFCKNLHLPLISFPSSALPGLPHKKITNIYNLIFLQNIFDWLKAQNKGK